MLALLFPGQGAQDARMADGLRSHPQFASRYEAIREHAGMDVLCALEGGDVGLLNQNLSSSLLTALVSALSLDSYLESGCPPPDFIAGYSVGQWPAMYAAGMLLYEPMVGLLAQRARLMDACVEREPGAMLAVIGLPLAVIESLLTDLRAAGHRIFVGNYNCPGHYSITGTVTAIQCAEVALMRHKPRKLLRLPVAGAWHCPLLGDAADELARVLAEVRLQPPRVPVIDNVTGDWLPQDPVELHASLARHLVQPVRWERGIERLIRAGATRLIEVGYGDMLTKFGFFIDRSVECRTYLPRLSAG